ncbi:MAG: LysR substrate-binding domain-containing protein, partial [Sciscionella sp.]
GVEVALDQFAEAGWIMSGPDSHFGRAARAACRRSGFEPHISHEVAEQATAMAMVAAGLGITLVSDLGLAFRPRGVDILPLSDRLCRKIVIAYRSRAWRRPALQVFLNAVHDAAAAVGQGMESIEETQQEQGHQPI